MLFNTETFIVFFVIVLLIYWILPGRIRYMWLLLSSYYFYAQWNAKYCILLLFVTAIAYFGGLGIQQVKKQNDKKGVSVLFLCIAICIGQLCIFKYLNFGIQIINRVLPLINNKQISWVSNIVLPVGISFFTLQAVGYLIDVYRNEIYAEKNVFRFALFLAFFPQLVAGPIERSKGLLKQIGTKKHFSFDNLQRGIMLMLWGLFVKMVIADRASVFVDMVYGDYQTYGGFYILIATILFSIQIYCDFYGYSTIARGAALTMGFSLMENFNAPYYSRSIKEFWRRWHISLSSWFREYLYIPLGGNRKGNLRKQLNLMIVFGVSGLWHGASLAYVFWGLLNGFYQVFSDLIKPIKEKCSQIFKYSEKLPDKVVRTCITFMLVSFAWLFFRAGGFREAVDILKSMMTVRNYNIFFDDSIYDLGISRKHFAVLISSIIVLFIVDYRKYKGMDVLGEFVSQNMWFRCLIEIALFFAILLFGCYGEMYDAATFIYFQF